jgi:hypothetical protein
MKLFIKSIKDGIEQIYLKNMTKIALMRNGRNKEELKLKININKNIL